MATYGFWVIQPPSRYESQFQQVQQRAHPPDLDQLRSQLELRLKKLDQIGWDSLSPEGCRKLRAELIHNRMPPEAYVAALEAGLARPVPAHSQPWWLGLPGLRQREQRLFRNDFMVMLERTRAGEAFETLGPDASPDWDWLCGRHGVMRSPFIAAQTSCRDLFDKVYESEAFAHMLTFVMEEHASSRQWPVSLREIPDYNPLPPLLLKEARYEALGVNLSIKWRQFSLIRPSVLRPQ